HGDDRLHAGKVRRGERPAATLLGNADRPQSGVGERRANEGDVFHARKADVANILAAPPEEPVVLPALDRGADALIVHAFDLLQPRSALHQSWMLSAITLIAVM